MSTIKIAITIQDHLQIRTLSTERLGKKTTKLSDKELDLVIEGLSEIIGSWRYRDTQYGQNYRCAQCKSVLRPS